MQRPAGPVVVLDYSKTLSGPSLFHRVLHTALLFLTCLWVVLLGFAFANQSKVSDSRANDVCFAFANAATEVGLCGGVAVLVLITLSRWYRRSIVTQLALWRSLCFGILRFF
jgi:hypothetical protein